MRDRNLLVRVGSGFLWGAIFLELLAIVFARASSPNTIFCVTLGITAFCSFVFSLVLKGIGHLIDAIGACRNGDESSLWQAFKTELKGPVYEAEHF